MLGMKPVTQVGCQNNYQPDSLSGTESKSEHFSDSNGSSKFKQMVKWYNNKKWLKDEWSKFLDILDDYTITSVYHVARKRVCYLTPIRESWKKNPKTGKLCKRHLWKKNPIKI